MALQARSSKVTEHPLQDRVAIVTGASRGIGRAIAERFAAEGARVVVNYVAGSAKAEAVVAGIVERGGDAIAVRADVSRSADVDALMAAALDRFGRIDILVNNAGVMFTKPTLETSEAEWDLTIATNLKGPYLCSKAVAPIMIRQGAGTIINMSSNSGLYHPSAMRFTEYVVSKAGINGLTKAMALAFGPQIRVNAICPGWIRTDMLEEIDPEVHQRILDESPIGRWGTPADIASAAVYLASDESSFVTGELHLVAGGRGMH
jgi:3-oxoacyl-[acyl-carrier protein] reductase